MRRMMTWSLLDHPEEEHERQTWSPSVWCVGVELQPINIMELFVAILAGSHLYLFSGQGHGGIYT